MRLGYHSRTECSFAALKETDGLVAGPPCTPWAPNGHKQGLGDTAAQVFVSVVAMIITLAQRGCLLFFTLENVPNIKNRMAGRAPFLVQLYTTFHKHIPFFAINHEQIQLSELGWPASRERIWIRGMRRDTLPAGALPPLSVRVAHLALLDHRAHIARVCGPSLRPKPISRESEVRAAKAAQAAPGALPTDPARTRTCTRTRAHAHTNYMTQNNALGVGGAAVRGLQSQTASGPKVIAGTAGQTDCPWTFLWGRGLRRLRSQSPSVRAVLSVPPKVCLQSSGLVIEDLLEHGVANTSSDDFASSKQKANLKAYRQHIKADVANGTSGDVAIIELDRAAGKTFPQRYSYDLVGPLKTGGPLFYLISTSDMDEPLKSRKDRPAPKAQRQHSISEESTLRHLPTVSSGFLRLSGRGVLECHPSGGGWGLPFWEGAMHT